MPAEALAFADLIENAASLSLPDFEKLMRSIRVRRAQRQSPNVLSKEEADLLRKIYHAFPAEKTARQVILNAKIWNETLSENEHSELLELIEAHETHAVERMESLLKLAMLRNVEYSVLVSQLGISPVQSTENHA